mgnify:CR=1 FL=1
MSFAAGPKADSRVGQWTQVSVGVSNICVCRCTHDGWTRQMISRWH